MSAAGNDGVVSEVDTCSSDEVSHMKLLQNRLMSYKHYFYGYVVSMYK